ncbi:MAG: DUF1045 domain-containing protein [Rhodobacteraceae bacterium]|nr:DUF1045 domain-containing protein [Paracoccaceae bacterium]
MMFTRYAIYYTPEPGPLASFGAGWLGWDAAMGRDCAHPDVPGLPDSVAALTATPRKYGFHGTIKPPFRLADGHSADDLAAALTRLCATRAAVRLDGLGLTRIGRFLALTPLGDTRALADLAGAAVAGLDAFRAPATEAELARRRAGRLSDRQDALLVRWGYPYVMEEFRFHLTLTGPLDPAALQAAEAALRPLVEGVAPGPVTVGDLTLLGEAEDGRFHHIARAALSG